MDYRNTFQQASVGEKFGLARLERWAVLLSCAEQRVAVVPDGYEGARDLAEDCYQVLPRPVRGPNPPREHGFLASRFGDCWVARSKTEGGLARLCLVRLFGIGGHEPDGHCRLIAAGKEVPHLPSLVPGKVDWEDSGLFDLYAMEDQRTKPNTFRRFVRRETSRESSEQKIVQLAREMRPGNPFLADDELAA